MKNTVARRLALVPKTARRCELHHEGVLRVETTPNSVNIIAVRLLAGSVRKESLALSREEFRALIGLLTEMAA